MDVHIRRASEEDLGKIQELNSKLFEKERREYDPTLLLDWPLSKEGEEYFLERMRNGFAAVVEVDDKIVGYIVGGEAEPCSYRKDMKMAELDNMFILKDLRGKGIGKKLTRKFVKWCEKNGFERIKTEASAQNKGAIKFYGKLGFEDYSLSLEKKLD